MKENLNMRKIFWLFLLFNLVLQIPSLAQSKKYFVITGKIMPETENTGGGNGSIEITKNGKETTNIDIPKNGRFRFELEFFSEYSLTFKYPGHFNKIILVSTEIPEDVWKRDNDFPAFPMIVQLTKEFEGVDKSFTLKPSGRIFYGKDIDNFEKESFINDLQFTEQGANAKNQTNQVAKEAATINKENAQDLAAKQKEFDTLIKEADTHYQRGEYQMALMKYLEAHKLFPDKAYPNDRVAELQDLVKALEITEKQKADLEQKYKSAIAKANGFYDQKSYKEARPVYEEALQFKPGDVFANGRINEIDQILALLEKQSQFKNLIANADNNYKSKKYDQAIALYNQAKALVPEDKYPQSQIDLINQEVQQQAKLDQLEKDFNQAMQSANTLTQQKDYLQAIAGYKKALGLKPDSQMAKDKIAELEQTMVAVENDKKFAQAIQLADQAMGKNDLSTAKMQYQEALKIKQDNYPKSKLAEIEATEAKEIDFNNFIAKGEKAYADKNLDEALTDYSSALKLKPQDANTKKKIEEIQNLKNKEASDKEYAQLIAQADQNFGNNQFDEAVAAYNKALDIKKNDTYAKDQLKKIDLYQSGLKKADKNFLSKDYDAAKLAFSNLLEIKPKDTYAAAKIAEIQKIEDDAKQQQEKEKATQLAYEEAIKSADQLFTAQSYNESANKYKDALAIKTNESYPQKRIKEIEGIFEKAEKEKARLDKEYQDAIAKGDNSFQSKDYSGAIAAYNSALQVKANDTYATGKIADIQKIQTELKQQEEKLRADQLAYEKVIKTADQLLADKNYTESESKYKEALSIKSAEEYPQKKIKEIEGILDGIAKDKAKVESDYKAAIALADDMFQKKDYPNSQNGYRKALTIKADQAYPKDQIQKIDQILADLKRQEAEALKQQQDKQDKAFADAMANGNKAFDANDFENARTAYIAALNIKPNDPVAKKKFGETEAKIAQLAKNTQAYNKAITEANAQLTAKKYPEAKEKYQEALLYLPNEDYPKRQIGKIDELLAQQAAELKTQQDFDQAVAEAEALFKNKELAKAKEAYTKAYNLIPSEPVPPKRIAEINGLLADQERSEAALKAVMEAYQKAIQKADNNFANKEYTAAQLAYNEALLIKSDEKYPQDQLNLIEKLLTEQKDKNYQAAIAKADKAFDATQLTEAETGYNEALSFKKDDKYATGRLAEIAKKRADTDAENARLKKLEQDYKNLIADANNDFNNKSYGVSREKYEKALTLKPNEAYPKDQIAKIDGLLAQMKKAEEVNKQYADLIQQAEDTFKAQKLKDARNLFQKAYYLKPFEPLPPMRIAEIDKLITEQDQLAQLAAQEEAQRKAKEKADKETYDKAIVAADKDFAAKQYKLAKVHYNEALIALPNEKYPKDQIAKCDELMEQEAIDKLAALQKARQDSIKRVNDQLFEAAMTSAKALAQNKQYEQAVQKYSEAISIKPDQRSAIQKLIDDLNNTIQLLAKQDSDYKRFIQSADGYFAQSKLNEALADYQNALKIKPNEEYPQNQIKEIQNQLVVEQKYNDAITKADKAYNSSDWINAKTAYTEALSIKPNESYPANRLKDVNQKISDANLAALSKAAEDKAYNEAIDQAEKAFKNEQLTTARMKFQEAQTIKPSEELPPRRIKEIDVLIDQRNKDRLAQQQRDLDEKYRQAIVLADNSYKEKSYSVAKLQYKQASLIKPDEQYPKTQMALMDKLMNEAKAPETYVMKLPEIEPAKPVSKPIINTEESAQTTAARAQNFVTTNDYGDAVKKADEAFGIKDYAVARFYYYKANDLKPTEEYPKKQIELIRKLIDSQMSTTDVSDYDKAIAQADAAFGNKNYTIAKFFYYKALDVKSWEKYPKDRIDEILALTNSLLSEREEKEYKDIIAKADEAYFNKDIVIARFYYNKALSIKRDEEYPKIKLKDIQKLIEQDARDHQNELYQSYIQLGDQAMQSGNYAIARFNYNKALTMRPDEKYPKDQIKAIKEAIEKRNN